MTPHHLGLELRQLVLRDRLEGRPLDPRRLQAAIGDLCGGEHTDLVVPLRSLVLSAAFASAAAQDPPLADPRQLGRLQQELMQIYAAPLCQRLQPVLQGLLGMAAPDPVASGAWGYVPPTAAAATPPLTALPPDPDPAPVASAALLARRSGPAGLTVLLAFVSGMLLMALAVISLMWLQQRSHPARGSRSLPPAAVSGRSPRPPVSPDPEAAVQPPRAEVEAPVPEPEKPAPEVNASAAEAVALDRSLASVNALYAALSTKDYARARSLFGAAAADQFDPAFFDQFARVTVQDLRLTSQTGSTINLEGVVSFVYPDGSLQSETRTFTLDSSGDPPLITASEFGRVIKPR